MLSYKKFKTAPYDVKTLLQFLRHGMNLTVTVMVLDSIILCKLGIKIFYTDYSYFPNRTTFLSKFPGHFLYLDFSVSYIDVADFS